ncbi:hypothetical protein ACFYV7_30840 [Nocardia suismassiliense]|uniref:Uncharacterized protein n=1 Tax=Nocardia suismassiliense TaxID=2077092 RepID=A0ABW6R1B3_9NOCA
MTFFVAAAGALVLIQAGWMVSFVASLVRSEPMTLPVWKLISCVIRRMRSVTTAELETGHSPSSEVHEAILKISDRQLDVTMVGGSVALAAWSQLFVSSASGPASKISGETLGLLFFGSLVSITAPILFRVSGIHLTYIGREFASSVGFGSIALALASAISDLVTGWPALSAYLIAAAVVVRHAFDVWRQIQATTTV